MKTKNNKIKFVYFFDKNLVFGFFVSVMSIFEQYNIDEVEIYVGFDVESKICAKKFLNNFGIKFKLVENYIKSKFSNFEIKYEIWDHTNVFTMGRIITLEVFPELNGQDKIIYLDPDVILKERIPSEYFANNKNYAISHRTSRQNISEKEKFCEKYLETIKNDEFSRVLRSKIMNNKYFNAGIIFINNTIEFNEIVSKIFESGINYDDQTLLNLNNEFEINVINDVKMNYIELIEEKKISNPIVVHFGTKFKPWNDKILDKEKREIFKSLGYYELESKVKKFIEVNSEE